jgi:hypothetical protein
MSALECTGEVDTRLVIRLLVSCLKDHQPPKTPDPGQDVVYKTGSEKHKRYWIDKP